MKKRLFALIMVAAMGIGLLAGCNGDDDRQRRPRKSTVEADDGDTDARSSVETDADGTIHRPFSKADADAQPSVEADADEDNVDTTAGAFKLGGIGPLTGGAAIYGYAVMRGAEIAVDEINARGGIQLELNYQDDARDIGKSINAYNVLKDWGMQVFLGSVTSGPGIATSVEANGDHIFYLTPSASSTDVIEGKDNAFQICFADPNQGSAAADYMAENYANAKIAVIYKVDDNYSLGIRNTFKPEADAKGLRVVYEGTFDESTQFDFSVQLAAAQAAGADLVFLPIYCDAAALILTQADFMGYTPTWFGVDGMDGILTMGGFDTSLAEGVVLLTPFNADARDAKTRAFVSKYQKLYGELPNQFAASGYDCVYAIYQALATARATPGMSAEALCDMLIKQFTTMTFDGLTGKGMTWGADGAVRKPLKGMVIRGGAYVGLD